MATPAEGQAYHLDGNVQSTNDIFGENLLVYSSLQACPVVVKRRSACSRPNQRWRSNVQARRIAEDLPVQLHTDVVLLSI